MLDHYQPKLKPFLRPQKSLLPEGLVCYYYHSFEDGLWDFLNHKFPQKKVTFLVPDFYCSDVLDNIKSRGHHYIYYPLDKDFQISSSAFSRFLWLYRPDVIIIFNACGISSRLLSDTGWIPDLPPSAWIIEDNVHRLTNPSSLRIINDRHLVMDSLRKVSPLPGSRMFGTTSAMSYSQAKSRYFSSYFIKSYFYYLLFRISLAFGISLTAHKLFLKAHDDLIGDSPDPHPGVPLLYKVVSHFDYSKVYRHKAHQVELYTKHLSSLFSSSAFYQIFIPKTDFGQLHVYPLGFSQPPNISLENYLHQHKIAAWFKFTDTPWSTTRGVIFLPLGFHISDSDIKYLCDTILSWT